jgi:two-component system, sensor histidine kinase and response regulator
MSGIITGDSIKSILIVDDNPQNLQVLGKMLLDNQYKIEFAINGQSALDWIESTQFDLILLDINMPGLNGFEVCRIIRTKSRFDNIPVIFLSADTDRESILKGFELGAQDYITKPFDSRELLVRVKTHLRLKDSVEKLENLNKHLEQKVEERTLQLKESNEKLEASNLKLLDLDKAKAGFLNLISHEIRTPLNGIMGPIELLKRPEYPREVSVLIDVLDGSVKRLERFSLDALLITRLKTKLVEVKKTSINLVNLISDVVELNKDRLEHGKLTLIRNDLVPEITIKGEDELIKKCIHNILDNAINYCPSQGVIEVSTYAQGNYVYCEVKDSGKGFTKSTDILFELFTTGDDYKDNRIGIGLPVAKMIMEAHSGSITICNRPEGGALVSLGFLKTM